MGKIRLWAPPSTETLDRRVFEKLLDTLFPRVKGSLPRIPAPETREGDWDEELAVSLEEARKELGAKAKAPGPDGIPGRARALALGEGGLFAATRRVLSECLKEVVFPPAWRRAQIDPPPQRGQSTRECVGLQAYKPAERGEQVARVHRCRSPRPTPVLGGAEPPRPSIQIQARKVYTGRSPVPPGPDRDGREEGGRVLLAVYLDIKNAFNTLPWPNIGQALEDYGVPVYLRPILSAYFGDRDLAFPKEDGIQGRRIIEHGVPQGSILGSLLWNIAFDRVLRTPLPLGCHVVCYADDTQLAPKVRGAGLAVASLLRTQVGPGWRAHRLYVNAILSIALYGAPIWAPQLRASRDEKRRLWQALKPLYT
ncbi:uncharacterized protein LOC105191053 [Harpegnathos saltator]|uniref:uncharacterized protein LOC105191053 n=1 Tax=Harpegnathos saltator TaxID=610380 RepID=UPI0005913A9F|nr:uncharacterized protein LOC105191053 [Harpegnathos saltator]